MSLFFAGTQDHALLAIIVQEARSMADVSYLGRTAVQKIVYFCKALNVPTRYRFEIHHYGPFSEQVASDIDLLIADEVIADRKQGSSYSDYAPHDTVAIEELLSNHREFANQFRPVLKKVAWVFGRLGPKDLELYATLHYAYRYEKASGAQPTMEEVVRRFRSYKGDRFPDEYVKTAYDAMLAAGLIAN